MSERGDSDAYKEEFWGEANSMDGGYWAYPVPPVHGTPGSAVEAKVLAIDSTGADTSGPGLAHAPPRVRHMPPARPV